MDANNPMLAVIPEGTDESFVQQVGAALGFPSINIVKGSPIQAVPFIQRHGFAPLYLLIDIGERRADILNEIDALAELCSTDTRAVVIGKLNDISFYRDIIQRGVLEYFTGTPKVPEVCAVLTRTESNSDNSSAIVCFMGAASGDGSSTIALNTAYTLSDHYKKSTVIIDMDFQFGMIARTLDLTSPYGIKEIFAHSGRTIDNTLLSRMVVPYRGKLNAIAAPNDLAFWPDVEVDMILGLLSTLKERYEYIIIDLPHIWSGWTAAALAQSTHSIMVAQLWLRSVTHTARLLSAWKETGISDKNIQIVINRSGARFKEALTAKDYETICHKKIDYYFANDIRTIAMAENQGQTITELPGRSQLAQQFQEFAGRIITSHTGEDIIAKGDIATSTGKEKFSLSMFKK